MRSASGKELWAINPYITVPRKEILLGKIFLIEVILHPVSADLDFYNYIFLLLLRILFVGQMKFVMELNSVRSNLRLNLINKENDNAYYAYFPWNFEFRCFDNHIQKYGPKRFLVSCSAPKDSTHHKYYSCICCLVHIKGEIMQD